jgi:hypothetical protein
MRIKVIRSDNASRRFWRNDRRLRWFKLQLEKVEGSFSTSPPQVREEHALAFEPK